MEISFLLAGKPFKVSWNNNVISVPAQKLGLSLQNPKGNFPLKEWSLKVFVPWFLCNEAAQCKVYLEFPTQASMLRERCNPNPDGDIEGGPKPTEKIIIKYIVLSCHAVLSIFCRHICGVLVNMVNVKIIITFAAFTIFHSMFSQLAFGFVRARNN